ncbi:MAG: glycosyltransferase family 39 protein [Deltaproteobacteria bacterium]|nr:glycosyltransferase family 39 protein [Deltaproteobacteria bacterium]
MKNRQLGHLGGMTDEWFDLGINISVFGEYSIGGVDPVVFRPPGYPFFVAGIADVFAGRHDLRVIDTDAKWAEWRDFSIKALNSLYLSQCVLLALSSVALFLWASRYFGRGAAFSGALLFGANPYSIVLTGLLHYDILHIFLIVVSTFLLTLFLENDKRPGGKMFLAGAAWGIATLVRPVTLTLPVFILAMLFIKSGSLRRAAYMTSALVLGMALVVLPYTARNYSLTGRVIPVNAQSWTALWGSTVTKFSINPNHYNWYRVYPDPYEKIFQRATGEGYTYEGLIRNNIKVEDEFKKSAIENLKKSPGTYVVNCLTSFFTLNIHINSVFIKVFQFIQSPDNGIEKAWFVPGAAQDFYPSTASNAFSFLVYALTGLSLLGLYLSLKKKDGFFLVPGAVYLALTVSHSLTYFDLMYYYIKMPFLFLFAFYAVNALGGYRLKGVPIPALLIITLLVYTFALDIAVFY